MRKIAALAAGALLAGTLVTSSAVADGPECNFYNHCYALAHHLNTGEFTAAGQELWTDCLELVPVSNDIATHEMWIIPSTGWIETGYVKGFIAGGDTQSGFRMFWAEYTGSTFYSHFIANAPILNYINFSAYKQTSGKWAFFTNGTYRGTTAGTYGNGTYVQTGGETTEPLVLSHGKSRYLQTRSASNNTWSVAPITAHGGTAGVYSVTTNGVERMEQISLQRICDPLPGGPPGTLKATAPPTVDDVKTLARKMAEANGEKNPTAEMVSTTRQRGVEGELDSNQNVFHVQMKGNFTGHLATRPKGYKSPTGNVMTVTVDKETGLVTDWSIGKNGKDLSKLGKVSKL